MYQVEVYEDDRCVASTRATTEREARRAAARMLGRRSLRGASQWESRRGGVAYQFGPRREGTAYPIAVISTL